MEIMDFHKVSAFNRALLIDWVLQVFIAFEQANSPSGLITAVNLMDQYMVSKYKQRQSLGVDRLFLIGMCAVLLTSKFEEIKPIKSQILLEKAGHNKFSHEELINMECDMLLAVGFRIHSSIIVVNEAMSIFIAVLLKYEDL
jgi:cyclin B/cyclin A